MANNALEAIFQLVKREIDTANNDGNTALMLASRNGHADIAKKLIVKGANLDTANNYGNTALMLASYNGYTDIVKELIAKEANLDAADNYGNTALILASRNGHADIVQLLNQADEVTPECVLTFIRSMSPRSAENC